jgi:Asp/Glu/hydantoin racemase
MVIEATRANPKLILVTGSSFSPCVDSARTMVTVPVIKVDERMAEEAVHAGRRLAIVATEQTTIGPTSLLLSQKADENKRDLELRTIYCEGAHRFLREGKPEEHDRIVLEKIRSENLEDIDAIVLAQVSVARVLSQVEKLTGKKVFSSPSTVVSVLRDLMTGPEASEVG